MIKLSSDSVIVFSIVSGETAGRQKIIVHGKQTGSNTRYYRISSPGFTFSRWGHW